MNWGDMIKQNRMPKIQEEEEDEIRDSVDIEKNE